jgi:hypothetical protein
VVQDVELIFDRHARRFEFANRADDVVVLHVACRIVIAADHAKAGMLASGGLNQAVQDEKVVMVPRKQDQGLLNGVQEMLGIVGTAEAGVSRGR